MRGGVGAGSGSGVLIARTTWRWGVLRCRNLALSHQRQAQHSKLRGMGTAIKEFAGRLGQKLNGFAREDSARELSVKQQSGKSEWKDIGGKWVKLSLNNAVFKASHGMPNKSP